MWSKEIEPDVDVRWFDHSYMLRNCCYLCYFRRPGRWHPVCCRRVFRIVVLQNSKDENACKWHGEARLLDPTGRLRREIHSELNNSSKWLVKYTTDKNKFMDNLKQAYYAKFGTFESCCLLIFSHFVPCTIKLHKCCEVIRKYAEETHIDIVIAYDEVYKDTNVKMSLRCLQSCLRVNILQKGILKTFDNSRLLTAQMRITYFLTQKLLQDFYIPNWV